MKRNRNLFLLSDIPWFPQGVEAMIGPFGFRNNDNRPARAQRMVRNGRFDSVEALKHAALPASGRTCALAACPI